MIESCFYCLFTHIRNQLKYNRCTGKCARCATYVHCKDGWVLSKHANREVYVIENFVEIHRFFHVQDRHGLALVTMAAQKVARTIYFYIRTLEHDSFNGKTNPTPINSYGRITRALMQNFVVARVLLLRRRNQVLCVSVTRHNVYNAVQTCHAARQCRLIPPNCYRISVVQNF